MSWMLDTNAWIQILKNPGGHIEQTLRSHLTTDILLCSVVKAELLHGANKYERRDLRLATLERLFIPFNSIPFDDESARHYADIRHGLERAGEIIGANDLMIAAICRANGLTLVTANTKEFLRVPDLTIEDWSIA